MTKRDPNLLEKIRCGADFVTDGCTMAPDLVFSECCVQHDIHYFNNIITREEADRRLRKCIASKGYPALAWVYWVGVRMFGWIPYHFGKSYEHRQKCLKTPPAMKRD